MSSNSAQAFALEAHAKVNLCLAIQYPPEAGYHRARTVMQELDLHDVLHFTTVDVSQSDAVRTSSGTSIALRCDVAGLDVADNLIFRAIDAAERACNETIVASDETLVINVDKRIPAGGGLGGGSSDAAAALKAFARLTGVDSQDTRLVAAAKALGADVPFFLYGGAALMGGRGDDFERALPPLGAPLVLMGDSEGMSTAQVYKAFDEDPAAAPDADALARAMENAPGDYVRIASLCINNLGPTACSLSVRVKERVKAAREHPDVLNALVSGSGATSFAICEDAEAANRLAKDISPLCSWVHVCRIPPVASCESGRS